MVILLIALYNLYRSSVLTNLIETSLNDVSTGLVFRRIQGRTGACSRNVEIVSVKFNGQN